MITCQIQILKVFELTISQLPWGLAPQNLSNLRRLTKLRMAFWKKLVVRGKLPDIGAPKLLPL